MKWNVPERPERVLIRLATCCMICFKCLTGLDLYSAEDLRRVLKRHPAAFNFLWNRPPSFFWVNGLFLRLWQFAGNLDEQECSGLKNFKWFSAEVSCCWLAGLPWTYQAILKQELLQNKFKLSRDQILGEGCSNRAIRWSIWSLQLWDLTVCGILWHILWGFRYIWYEKGGTFESVEIIQCEIAFDLKKALLPFEIKRKQLAGSYAVVYRGLDVEAWGYSDHKLFKHATSVCCWLNASKCLRHWRMWQWSITKKPLHAQILW